MRRAELDQELEAELEFHIAREAEKYERQGVPAAEARRRARLAFGGPERVKEETRDARGTALLESVLQDTRYALRGLRAKPGFAVGVGGRSGCPAVRTREALCPERHGSLPSPA